MFPIIFSCVIALRYNDYTNIILFYYCDQQRWDVHFIESSYFNRITKIKLIIRSFCSCIFLLGSVMPDFPSIDSLFFQPLLFGGILFDLFCHLIVRFPHKLSILINYRFWWILIDNPNWILIFLFILSKFQNIDYLCICNSAVVKVIKCPSLIPIWSKFGYIIQYHSFCQI